jgi:prepilin-type N-terminal cleavage/methylation domain-containing protein
MRVCYGLIKNQKGLTLVEVLVAALILAISLTPFIAYLSRNLEKVSDIRETTLAHSLAREGMERVRSLGYVLGTFYVVNAGGGSFIDDHSLSLAQSLKVRVLSMGGSSINVTVNGGAASCSIPAGAVPGKLIDLTGSDLADVTGITISGGSFGDKFEIIGAYPDLTQTLNNADWTTKYEFVDETAPLQLRIGVFKGLATTYTTQLIGAVETLR